MRGLGELTPEQRQLFDRLLAQTNDHRLRPRPSGETPLSYAQERIYFLEQLGPQSTAYTVAWGFDVVGPLDCGCLKEAFRRLRDRHEILRARCVKTSTGARLEFEPPGPVEVLELDLRGLARDEVTTRATELIRAPFELTAGSLSRLSLIRVGPDEHVLLLHSHHLIVDSWSAKVILRELGSVYAALVQAREPALEPLPLSYSDFAFWQRQRQQNWAQEIAYWKEALAGAPTCLTLPTDHSRPAFRSYRGQKHHFRVDSALADQLAESARQGGVTLFSLLLALFGAYLGRLSGQSEVVIGAALSDRFPAETEAMVGSFAHLLPLLCGCGPDETLADLLPRVRQTVAGALAHKEVPFERLVDELAPPRNLDHDPIFQVMFVLHEDPLEEELHLLGCQVRRRVLEKGGSRFDLMLEMVDGENELFGWFEYSLDLFEPATIAAMTEQFWLLVAGALAAPEAPLADLPLVPPSQPEPSLGPALAIDPEVRVESLIASQAALRPEQLAVDQLTYAQLAEQVQVRAASLLSQGLAAGQLVSLSSYKNSQLLVSMLAVWRCQASFLPLGPDWPARRRQAVVAASGCHWQWEQEVWRAGPGGSPFDSSRAYAMATSGSSGLPKVVAVSHRSLANLLLSMADEPGFGPDDSLLSVTTPTFDIALLEFFLPLVAGGSVQLLPDVIRGGCGLRQALERGQPSVVQATPTMWRMLL
ncbi:MAG: condensation domain-containing protein, partial [Vulcanimicrobiota bacterium]